MHLFLRLLLNVWSTSRFAGDPIDFAREAALYFGELQTRDSASSWVHNRFNMFNVGLLLHACSNSCCGPKMLYLGCCVSLMMWTWCIELSSLCLCSTLLHVIHLCWGSQYCILALQSVICPLAGVWSSRLSALGPDIFAWIRAPRSIMLNQSSTPSSGLARMCGLTSVAPRYELSEDHARAELVMTGWQKWLFGMLLARRALMYKPCSSNKAAPTQSQACYVPHWIHQGVGRHPHRHMCSNLVTQHNLPCNMSSGSTLGRSTCFYSCMPRVLFSWVLVRCPSSRCTQIYGALHPIYETLVPEGYERQVCPVHNYV